MNNSIMLKEIFEQPQVIKKSLSFNMDLIRSISSEIKAFNPSLIVLSGRGSSEHACIYAKYLFEIFCGIPAVIAAPSVLTAYNAELNLDKAVTIGVSQSGEALDVLEVINRTNRCGGITVSITNTAGSPVAKASKYNLDCCGGKEEGIAATKTFMLQMALVSALTAYISNNVDLLGCIYKLDRSVQAALDMMEEVEKSVEYFRFIDECFILSRGLSYGLAAEAELKIQETCYINAHGYAVSDYAHGPITLISPMRPGIFIEVDKTTNANVREMYNRFYKQGVYALVITNDSSIASEYPASLLLPEWCEGIPGIFAAGTLIQMFACFLSVLKGHDPDAPKGHSKITVTR